MALRRLEDKLAHIDAALDGGSEVPAEARQGALTFDRIRFSPVTLPEIDLGEVDLSIRFLNKQISAPLMVSPMTGGLQKGGDLNRRMAAAAEAVGIPFGVGSQRVALEVESRAKDFKVRDVAPTIPLFANLGAIQLVKGYDASHAQRAVEMIEADALYLHLNAMQEVVQEGGDTNWRGVLEAIEEVCTAFTKSNGVPVFAREVGFGIPKDQAQKLIDAGVSGIDCSGGGGTSWTLVEGRVASSDRHHVLGRTFASWGLTTPESIVEVRRAAKDLPVIASGGIRSGLDAAKSLALGATIAGMASPVLRAAVDGEEAVIAFLETTIMEIRATLFGVGARDPQELRANPRFYGLPVDA